MPFVWRNRLTTYLYGMISCSKNRLQVASPHLTRRRAFRTCAYSLVLLVPTLSREGMPGILNGAVLYCTVTTMGSSTRIPPIVLSLIATSVPSTSRKSSRSRRSYGLALCVSLPQFCYYPLSGEIVYLTNCRALNLRPQASGPSA